MGLGKPFLPQAEKNSVEIKSRQISFFIRPQVIVLAEVRGNRTHRSIVVYETNSFEDCGQHQPPSTSTAYLRTARPFSQEKNGKDIKKALISGEKSRHSGWKIMLLV